MIAIDFGHDLLPYLLVAILQGCLTSRPMEDLSQLGSANLPITILVKHVESDAQILLIDQPSAVHCSCDELSVVDLTVTIGVQLVYKVVPVLAARPHEA